MKVFLMYPDQDIDPDRPLPAHADDLIQDLELATLFRAMAQDDEFLEAIARTVVLSSLTDIDTIIYRQQVLDDCKHNADVVDEIYRLAVEAIEKERKSFHFGMNRASGALRHAVEILEIFVDLLKRLRAIASQHAGQFESPGFKRFFSMLKSQLNEEYFAVINHHIEELRLHYGVLISARLGQGNKGVDFVLRELPENRRGMLNHFLHKQPTSHTFDIDPRDQGGIRALSEIEDRALVPAANAASQSSDHILSFFRMLRAELAFYIGGLNLHGILDDKGLSVCFPEPAPMAERHRSFNGLYDVCLSLTMNGQIVGNDLEAETIDLVFITGANQGGKSTFLRSIGVAQLMMQCGLFVPADAFRASLCSDLFTHYKREEDAAMESGKFEEELLRISAIVDDVSPNALVLFNESFSATNEREGSEIARHIVDALLDVHIQVFYVTHFYELASAFHGPQRPDALFLRADRQADGQRSFKLVRGEPLPTSYGQDLYARIFEEPVSDDMQPHPEHGDSDAANCHGDGPAQPETVDRSRKQAPD